MREFRLLGSVRGAARHRTRPTKASPYRNPERAVPTAINVEAEASSPFTLHLHRKGLVIGPTWISAKTQSIVERLRSLS